MKNWLFDLKLAVAAPFFVQTHTHAARPADAAATCASRLRTSRSTRANQHTTFPARRPTTTPGRPRRQAGPVPAVDRPRATTRNRRRRASPSVSGGARTDPRRVPSHTPPALPPTHRHAPYTPYYATSPQPRNPQTHAHAEGGRAEHRGSPPRGLFLIDRGRGRGRTHKTRASAYLEHPCDPTTRHTCLI